MQVPPPRSSLPSSWHRAVIGLVTTSILAVALAFGASRWRNDRTRSLLEAAAARLERMDDHLPADNLSRASIAWGYSESLRLGLESPFRLIERSARDPRFTRDDQRTVAWGLLARVLRGDSHHIDPAALDAIGPWTGDGRSAVAGEWHLAVIDSAIRKAHDPRAGELAVRLAYSLASSERLVSGIAPTLAAEAAALLADREIARREARDVARSAGVVDAIEIVKYRRAKRAFYAERPVMLSGDEKIQSEAVHIASSVVATLRSHPVGGRSDLARFDRPSDLVEPLMVAGSAEPPIAPLAVTVQRYLPTMRFAGKALAARLERVHNTEMLVAALGTEPNALDREKRRAISRMVLAAAVAMRTLAQDGVANPDGSLDPQAVAARLGFAAIDFDAEVPSSWRPYFLTSLSKAVLDLRRVLPMLRLSDVRVRFRTSAPADSALAMHDPRTRTLHLPVLTSGGTLTHELAHEIDRQSAAAQGLPGYRSDNLAYRRGLLESVRGSTSRLAASLRALSDELSDVVSKPSTTDRPAEVFATRVDWFVTQALAQQGISDGFLSAVQDEMLTGHVLHPERLRTAGSGRSLVAAIDGMTRVAPSATETTEPSVYALTRWALSAAIDRPAAREALAMNERWSWVARFQVAECAPTSPRARVLRMAAESRARGWLRTRAKFATESDPWKRAAVSLGPWSVDDYERRVAVFRDVVLQSLANASLSSGVAGFTAPIARQALCEE